MRPGIACLQVVLFAAAAGRRIVSTSPSITESLFALGLGDRVVGVSTYCRFPAEVAHASQGRHVSQARHRSDRAGFVPISSSFRRVPTTFGVSCLRSAFDLIAVDQGGLDQVYATILADRQRSGRPGSSSGARRAPSTETRQHPRRGLQEAGKESLDRRGATGRAPLPISSLSARARICTSSSRLPAA